MAVMFKELHGPEFYSFDQNESGSTGRRTFQRNDDAGSVAAASLPVVGTSLMVDPADANVPNCFCRSKTATFVEGDALTIGYVFEYSTKDSTFSGSGGGHGPKNPASRSYEMGLEENTFLTGESDGKVAKFEFVGATSGSEYAEQNVPVFANVGAISIPHANQAMDATAKTAFLTLVATYGRTINSVAFEGFAIGQVRYDGYTGGDYYNEAGAQRWAFELHFSVKQIGEDLNGTLIAEDDWLYQINEKEGLYRKLKNHATGKFLYEKKAFAALLA